MLAWIVCMVVTIPTLLGCTSRWPRARDGLVLPVSSLVCKRPGSFCIGSLEATQRSLTSQEGEAMKKEREREKVSWPCGLSAFPRLSAKHVGKATLILWPKRASQLDKPSVLSLVQVANQEWINDCCLTSLAFREVCYSAIGNEGKYTEYYHISLSW